ncbi:hypothetical protein C8R42DRAFT_89513 [Lentinula raphanica]|nr:hypothetical protein C8R42DRAFT_89513 [Lentinula raphanica]
MENTQISNEYQVSSGLNMNLTFIYISSYEYRSWSGTRHTFNSTTTRLRLSGLRLLSLGTGTGMNRGNGLQFVGDRTVMKTLNRMYEWRKTIRESEKKRVRKEVLDLRETRCQISRLYDHTLTPTNIGERELWRKLIEKRGGRSRLRRLWRLDETEGKNSNLTTTLPTLRIHPMPVVIIPPFPMLVVPSLSIQRQRRVGQEQWRFHRGPRVMKFHQQIWMIINLQKRLQKTNIVESDMIECVGAVARVAGVDSSPGLLILGRTHIYMRDGLVGPELKWRSHRGTRCTKVIVLHSWKHCRT